MSNQSPYTQPPRRVPWIVSIVTLTFVLFILVRVASTTMTPVSVTRTPTTHAATRGGTTATSSPQTFAFSGNGNKQTAFFDVPENWTLAYTCYGFTDGTGMTGEMSVSVYGPGAALLAANVVDATCAIKGSSDSTEEHSGGRIYLGIIATGAWRLTVQTHP